MPSRQERRNAERGAARASAQQAGASGATDRRPALENVPGNVNVDPLGDRTTRASVPNVLRALGAEKRVADAAEKHNEALEAGMSCQRMKRVEASRSPAPTPTPRASRPKLRMHMYPHPTGSRALAPRCTSHTRSKCECRCRRPPAPTGRSDDRRTSTAPAPLPIITGKAKVNLGEGIAETQRVLIYMCPSYISSLTIKTLQ